MPRKRNAMAMGEAAAARAAAATRKKRQIEADELEPAKKVKSRKAKEKEIEEVEEEEEGEEEEEDEESEGGSTELEDVAREMDVDVVLARKRKTWEEKEEMILAVDKIIAEADAKTAAKLDQLRKARDSYPTAVAVS
jgi:flagellar motor switch/type III secretory pathway protein FliN